MPPSKKARTAADSCRLALWASLPGGANPQSLGINFHAPDFGQHPFPVISMPITFALPKPDLEAAAIKGKARKIKPPKQERIERKYVLPKFIDENGATRRKVLTVTEQTSFDLDKVILTYHITIEGYLTFPYVVSESLGLRVGIILMACESDTTPRRKCRGSSSTGQQNSGCDSLPTRVGSS